jgi:hypothetical protein
MNRHRAFVVLGAIALLAFLALILVLHGPRMTETELILHNARTAAKKGVALQSKRIWISPSIVFDMLLGKASVSDYGKIVDRSSRQLLDAGYLEQRTFRFQFGCPPWQEFSDAVHRTFNRPFHEGGELFSYGYLKYESSVVVFARPTCMTAWEQLVHDYDKADH